MYEIDTVLELKEKKSTDDKLFPYDEVRVVGPSPVDHTGTGHWQGRDAQGVVLQPITDFDANIDEPLGKIQALYSVKSVPERVIEQPKVRIVDSSTAAAGKTPEEVFAEEAPGEASVAGERVKTPFKDESPLEDPRKESVLD